MNNWMTMTMWMSYVIPQMFALFIALGFNKVYTQNRISTIQQTYATKARANEHACMKMLVNFVIIIAWILDKC